MQRERPSATSQTWHVQTAVEELTPRMSYLRPFMICQGVYGTVSAPKLELPSAFRTDACRRTKLSKLIGRRDAR